MMLMLSMSMSMTHFGVPVVWGQWEHGLEDVKWAEEAKVDIQEEMGLVVRVAIIMQGYFLICMGDCSLVPKKRRKKKKKKNENQIHCLNGYPGENHMKKSKILENRLSFN